MKEKKLIAIIKDYDGDGTTMYYKVEDIVDWKNIEEQIRIKLEEQQDKQCNIRFVMRTEKWYQSLPELD